MSEKVGQALPSWRTLDDRGHPRVRSFLSKGRSLSPLWRITVDRAAQNPGTLFAGRGRPRSGHKVLGARGLSPILPDGLIGDGLTPRTVARCGRPGQVL
eukprot:741559-Lingulodinium_polyedra.AAC.1